MAEELKACPFCSCTDIGEVTINPRLEQRHRRFKVYCKACQCRTSDHKTRKEARIYWNTRAQLPRQGGEAVEVVGYGCAGQIEVLKHVPLTGGMKVSGRQREKYSVPLMTVAQHQRILAAAAHPADQVADDLTMVKVSRELLEEIVELHRRRGVVLIIHVEQLAELMEVKP